MEDATNYACSKILPMMNARSLLTNTDSDSDSANSPLLGDKTFGKLEQLSHESLEEYCRILPFSCLSTVTFMHNMKIVMLQIVGVHVHHPYEIGLSNMYPYYNTGPHTVIAWKTMFSL